MTSPIRRIIVVDDHEAVRRGVRQLLETTPYYQVVGEAADGRAGLELAKQEQPDIAIIDYSIPGMNGVDLSHALKRDVPSVRVLLYTMHDREEIIIEALRNGVRALLLKSDSGADLIAVFDVVGFGLVVLVLASQFLVTRAEPTRARAR